MQKEEIEDEIQVLARGSDSAFFLVEDDLNRCYGLINAMRTIATAEIPEAMRNRRDGACEVIDVLEETVNRIEYRLSKRENIS